MAAITIETSNLAYYFVWGDETSHQEPWRWAMERFIRRQNVEHYRRLLATVIDETEHQRILQLLADEQKKQREAGDLIDEKLGHGEIAGSSDAHS